MPLYSTPDGATRDDVARVITAADPGAEAAVQMAALERLEDWVADEKSKWEHALQLAALLGQGPAATNDDDAPEATATTNGSGPTTPDGARPTRRQAILRILEEQPRKSWKLSDLVAEMERRGWTGESKYEDHMVLRTLSTMMTANQVKRPRKGFYKLVAPTLTAAASSSSEGAGDD
jgi:hypothetical protein